jgi:Zn-dependent metalloprotease
MKNLRFFRALALTLPAILLAGAAHGQLRSIPSLTETGEGLTVRSVAPDTGLVTFATSSGRGILLDVSAVTSAEGRALAFIDAYGSAFGLTRDRVRLYRAPFTDTLGIDHVRLQQVEQGVPVRGGELIVHLKGSRVTAVNGHTLVDLPRDLRAQLPASVAIDEARRQMQKHEPQLYDTRYSEPRLEIFNRALLSETSRYPSRLAWFIEAAGPMVRRFIWVDAKTGAILLNLNQLTDAKSRNIHTANHTDTLPGTLVRSEGGAVTGDADQDNAYTYSGLTYDYYFNEHGRDSFDNAGGTLISTAHYCEDDCPAFPNAFWNGDQMVYGDGYASADDVVAHELTHAVTERTAGLLYYYQAGALNESFSDIFGETVDLTDGVGNDASGVRWKLAEDLPIGAIRDMMNPGVFSDPARMTDPNFFCTDQGWTDPFSDSGGVHFNSGIPNHAYALMVDGGTYNSQTITGIGLTKAAKVQYRALTTYLTSGATFLDNYHALNQSCTELIGTAGIAAGDCTQIDKALLAVEMNATWGCAGAIHPPAQCASGTVSVIATEGFEAGLGNWTETNSATGIWGITEGYAKSGLFSEWGDDVGATTDIRLSMTNAVNNLPANAKFYFDHSFEFESDAPDNYDGGVIEYSTNGGANWTDAGSLIDGGKTYGGTIDDCCSNPLQNRTAFVRASFGYTGTRLNLASLAGQNVKLRFRIGTDSSVGSMGWFVDNPTLYTCVTAVPFTDDPLVVHVTPIKRIHIIELRTRIDALRVAHSLSAFSWTDPTITVGTTMVKAVHITEMRTALAQAYTAAGAGAGPTYTDPSLAAGGTVKKVHIDELRAGVLALE